MVSNKGFALFQVHVLPREIYGKSTFELAVILLKWLPVWLADKLLLLLSWFILGSMEKYGLKRPSMGPMELKNTQGKTPVLDIGALDKIKAGGIKVVPGIKRFSYGRVELVDGEVLDIDSVVLATGYRSNVPSWLQVRKNSWKLCLFMLACVQQLLRLGNFECAKRLILYLVIVYRKVNFSPRVDSQSSHSHMAGKEMPDFTQSGSQGEGSLVLHVTP